MQAEMAKTAAALRENIQKVIVGKDRQVEYLLAALLAGGHVLMEDIPGTGKTKLAKSLAASLNADFKRIQFTPDLLPTDVTGLKVFDRKEDRFVLKKGPVFTNILLADEINRATPRTQAGLLECMGERQVTIDGETHALAAPFFVIATQNPVETAGTFPLPEAQMDRFMMRLSMGYPGKEEELAILRRFEKKDPILKLAAVAGPEEVKAMQEEAAQVFVHDCVMDYIVRIIQETRRDREILLGVSPRGSLALLRSARALAAVRGRSYVNPDDVKELAVPVLAHRLILSAGRCGRKDCEAALAGLLELVPAPTEGYEA